MKKLVFVLYLVWLPFLSNAQKNSTPNLEAYFSAFIVTGIDVSIDWYSNVLGFTEINRVESIERGFKQSNLSRGNMLIELIELDKAINIKDVIPDYSTKMRTVGLFKIGFRVTDFEKWIDHLTTEKVDFYGSIVKDDSTGKRMVIITDPDGNRIQIFEK